MNLICRECIEYNKHGSGRQRGLHGREGHLHDSERGDRAKNAGQHETADGSVPSLHGWLMKQHGID